jgi:flagellar biogenesis protein FliO
MGTKVNSNNNNKYIKVIERVQVSKENTVLVVKIGKKGYVMTSSTGHMGKLSELSEEEINLIEEDFRVEIIKVQIKKNDDHSNEDRLSKCKEFFEYINSSNQDNTRLNEICKNIIRTIKYENKGGILRVDTEFI